MSGYFLPHGLQHTRLPCTSLSPRVCSNSCPLSQWCHPTISSSVALFSSLISPSIKVFSNGPALLIKWPKYWSFSISPSNEYWGLCSLCITQNAYLKDVWDWNQANTLLTKPCSLEKRSSQRQGYPIFLSDTGTYQAGHPLGWVFIFFNWAIIDIYHYVSFKCKM